MNIYNIINLVIALAGVGVSLYAVWFVVNKEKVKLKIELLAVSSKDEKLIDLIIRNIGDKDVVLENIMFWRPSDDEALREGVEFNTSISFPYKLDPRTSVSIEYSYDKLSKYESVEIKTQCGQFFPEKLRNDYWKDFFKL